MKKITEFLETFSMIIEMVLCAVAMVAAPVLIIFFKNWELGLLCAIYSDVVYLKFGRRADQEKRDRQRIEDKEAKTITFE